jgi:hypothetical protein
MSLLDWFIPHRKEAKCAIEENTRALRRLRRAMLHSIIKEESVRETLQAANEAVALIDDRKKQNGSGR